MYRDNSTLFSKKLGAMIDNNDHIFNIIPKNTLLSRLAQKKYWLNPYSPAYSNLITGATECSYVSPDIVFYKRNNALSTVPKWILC